jgi:hypothetical protein
VKRHIALGLMAAATVLALPSAAEAKPVRGTVLSLDRRHHTARVILPGHDVRRFHCAGKLSRKIRAGSRISADLRGHELRRVRASGRARVLKFYGRVVRKGRRLPVLRLGDGARLALGDTGAAPISISIQGLEPGQTVLVTITLGSSGVEGVSIQIERQDPGGDGSGSGSDGGDGSIDHNDGDDYVVDGTVTAVDPDAGTLEIDAFDGHLSFTADPDVLDGISAGDDVEVYFARDTSTDELIADDVYQLDSSGDWGDDSGDLDAILHLFDR